MKNKPINILYNSIIFIPLFMMISLIRHLNIIDADTYSIHRIIICFFLCLMAIFFYKPNNLSFDIRRLFFTAITCGVLGLNLFISSEGLGVYSGLFSILGNRKFGFIAIATLAILSMFSIYCLLGSSFALPVNNKSMGLNSHQSFGLVKGMAITLMIIHHFFGFPSWYVYPMTYVKDSVVNWLIAYPTKLCVPLFAFITGASYALHKDKSFRYSLRKIISFLCKYWIVYALMLITAIVFCHYQPTANIVLLEMFGLKRPIMYFCWYVYFYIFTMLALPIYCYFSKDFKNPLHDILLAAIFCSLMNIASFTLHSIDIYSILHNLSAFFPSVVFAAIITKYDLLNIIKEKLSNIPQIIFLLPLVIVCLYFNGPVMSYITIPILMILLSFLNLPDIIKRIGLFLGKHSINIWFLHCIFFAKVTKNMFQPYAFALKNPILIVISVLAVLSLLSIVISKLQNIVSKSIEKLI